MKQRPIYTMHMDLVKLAIGGDRKALEELLISVKDKIYKKF